MSCIDSKALVVSLMSDNRFAKKFSEMSTEIADLKGRLLSPDVKDKRGLEDIIQEKEALLEAFILGTGLKNTNTKIGFASSLKKGRVGGFKKAVELIEIIDTAEGFESVSKFIDDLDFVIDKTTLSKQVIEEKVIKYIQNDSIIKSRYEATSGAMKSLKKLYKMMGQDAGKVLVQGAMFTQGGGAGLTKALDIAKNIGKKNFESTLDDVTQQAPTTQVDDISNELIVEARNYKSADDYINYKERENIDLTVSEILIHGDEGDSFYISSLIESGIESKKSAEEIIPGIIRVITNKEGLNEMSTISKEGLGAFVKKRISGEINETLDEYIENRFKRREKLRQIREESQTTKQTSTSSNVKKIEEFTIGYAPFREGNIKNISDVNFNNMGKKYQDRLDLSQEMSKMFGVSISKQNKSVGIYSTTSDLGEASQYNTVMGTKEDVEAFAAMMGTLAPDIQDSVLIGRYSAKGKGKEIRFDVKGDVQEFIQSMKENGLSDMSYIPETKTIVLIDSDNSFGKSQLNFISTSYKNGQITKPRKRKSDIRFIGENEYGGILETYRGTLTDRGDGAVGMTELRDAISYAKDKSRRGSLSFRKELAKKRKEALDGVLGYIEKNKKSLGLEDYKPTKVKKIDTEYANKIAESFDNVIDYNDVKATNEYKKKVKESYESLSKEVELQYKFLTSPKSEGGLGIKIEFIKDDPYKSSEEMMEDVLRNNRLKIYQGGEPNEFMSKVDETGLSTNEKFRAVHDYFGHFVEMNSFGQVGEEGARVAHSKMFSKKARGALTIETRGQNSWVNSPGKNDESKKLFIEGNSLIQKGKISEGLFKKEKGGEIFQYAEQKTGLLPEEFVSYEKYVTDKSEYTDFDLISREDIETLKITEEISKKIDIKKITEDDIYNIDNIGDLEKLVQYNIDDFIYGENKVELFSVFSQKLDELKLKADYENILQKQYVTPQEKTVISIIGKLLDVKTNIRGSSVEISSNTRLMQDNFQLSFGRKITDEESKNLRNNFLKFIQDGTEFELGGIKIDNNNIHRVITLLGAKELSSLSIIGDLDVGKIASLSNVGDSMRYQLMDAIINGNEDKFIDIISEGSQGKSQALDSNTLGYYTVNGIDEGADVIHLDFGDEYFEGNSSLSKSRGYEQYEQVHGQKQILVQKGEGFKKLKDLEEHIKKIPTNEKNKTKVYVLVSQQRFANSKKLIDFNKKMYGQNYIVHFKASDIAGQNFSYGYNNGYITLRAKDGVIFDRMVKKLTAYKGGLVEVVEKEIEGQIEKLTEVMGKNISNMNIDTVDLDNIRKSITIEQIKEEFYGWMRLMGYGEPQGVELSVGFEKIREIFLDFSYTSQDDIGRKREAASALREIFGYTSDKGILRHQHISYFFDSLLGKKYNIPNIGVRTFVEEYLRNGTVSEAFVTSFKTANRELLESQKLDGEDVLEGILSFIKNDIKVGGTADDYLIKPRIGVNTVIVNGPTDDLNNIKQRFIQKGKSGELSIADGDYIKKLKSIFDKYYKNRENAVNSGSSVERLDKIRFDLFQELDEFENSVFNELKSLIEPYNYKKFFGGKFFFPGAYTKQDAKLLRESLDDYIQSFDKTLKEDVAGGLKDIKEGRSTSKILQVNGVTTVVDIDDQIIYALSKVSKDSDFFEIRGISKKSLNSIDEQTKINLLRKIDDSVTNDIKIKGLVLKRLEDQSSYLSNVGFAKNYKTIMSKMGSIPEAMKNNEFGNKYWGDDIDLQSKVTLFDNIKSVIKNNTFDIEKNIENLDEYIEKEVEKIVNNYINSEEGKELSYLGMNGVEEFKNMLIGHYQAEFSPYAHITPLNKKFIEKAKEIYGVDGSLDEFQDYLPKETKILNDNPYEGLDEGLKNFYEKGDESYTKRLMKEIQGIEDVGKLAMSVNRRIGDFYARDVFERNGRLKKIYEAFKSVGEQAEDAETSLKFLYNSPYAATVVIDKNSYLSTKLLSSLYIDTENLKLVQDKVESLIDLNEIDFQTFGRTATESVDIAAYKNALLYRRLRSSLGTNGNGAGPTLDADFNNAIHNLHKSFTSISGGSKKSYKELSRLLNFRGSGKFFYGINTSGGKNVAEMYKILHGGTIIDQGDNAMIMGGLDISKNNSLLRKLFGLEDISENESTIISNFITGISRGNKIDDFFSNTGRVIGSLPLAYPIFKGIAQFGANVMYASGSIVSYLSLLGKGLRAHDYEDLDFAESLRYQGGFLGEIGDLNSLRQGIFLGEDIGLFKNLNEVIGKENVIKASVELSEGKKVTSLKTILGGIESFFIKSFDKGKKTLLGNRSLETLFMNGQNWSDMVFSGMIKNIATADAIKTNSYRPFANSIEMKAFLETASQEEIDRLMNSIRAKANKIYNDRAGTNFSGFDQPINPYQNTFKRGAFDAVMYLQNSMAYLNGWGLSITRNFFRTINQAANLAIYNIKNPSEETIRKSIEWIQKTPEFKAYMSGIIGDFLNAYRIARFDHDGEELTFEKFYKILTNVSVPLIALNIVGINRPVMGFIDELISDDTNLTPIERFNLDFRRNLFNNIKIPGRAMQLYMKLISGDEKATEYIKDYFVNAAGGGIRFAMGRYASNGNLYYPGQKNATQNVLGFENKSAEEQIMQSINDAGIMERTSKDVLEKYDRSKFLELIDIFGDINTNIGFVDDIGKIISGTYGQKILGTAKNTEKFINSILDTETGKEIKINGYAKLKNQADIDIMEKQFFYDNIFSMSLDKILTLFGDFENGSVYNNDYFPSNEKGTLSLLEYIGKDGIIEIKNKLLEEEVRIGKLGLKSGEEKGIIKGKLNDILKGYVESSDVKQSHQWLVMYEISKEKELLDSQVKEIKVQAFSEEVSKLGIYNTWLEKRIQQNKPAADRFNIEMLATKEGEKINKATGLDFFSLKQPKGNGKPFWSLHPTWTNTLEQNLDVSKALDEGDFEKASILLNQLGQSRFSDSPTEAAGVALSSSLLVDSVMKSNMTDREKLLLISEYGENNFDSLFDNLDLLKGRGVELNDVLGPFFDTAFTVEAMLPEELKNMNIDDSNDGKGKGKSGGGKAVKVGKVDYDKLLKFKNTLSKGLDKFRADYKLQEFKPSEFAEKKTSYWENEIKTKYPISGTAKTKTPAGLAAESKKQTKDISRTIKKKKRKLPKPLV